VSEPHIDLGAPQNLFCPRHLEPFRAEWPRGYPGMLLVLFQHAVRDREILRACGWDPGRGVQAEVARMGAAIREFGPICCRLDPDELARWTELALGPDHETFMLELHALEAAPVPSA
jgi:hypothetical protein